MNTSPLFANAETVYIIVGSVSLIFVFFVFAAIWASRFVKVGPNQVLIVYGRRIQLPDGSERGFRIVKGGGTFVFPVIEKLDLLTLEIFNLEHQFPKIYTRDGNAYKFSVEAQVKIKGDDDSIVKAAERFIRTASGADPLDNRTAIKAASAAALEKHLNALLGAPQYLELLTNPPLLANQLQTSATVNFGAMGLEILNLAIRDMQKL
jgi:flotillin